MVAITIEDSYMRHNTYKDASVNQLVSVLQGVAQLASDGFSVSIRNIPMDRVQNIVIDITQGSNESIDLICRYIISIEE